MVGTSRRARQCQPGIAGVKLGRGRNRLGRSRHSSLLRIAAGRSQCSTDRARQPQFRQHRRDPIRQCQDHYPAELGVCQRAAKGHEHAFGTRALRGRFILNCGRKRRQTALALCAICRHTPVLTVTLFSDFRDACQVLLKPRVLSADREQLRSPHWSLAPTPNRFRRHRLYHP